MFRLGFSLFTFAWLLFNWMFSCINNILRQFRSDNPSLIHYFVETFHWLTHRVYLILFNSSIYQLFCYSRFWKFQSVITIFWTLSCFLCFFSSYLLPYFFQSLCLTCQTRSCICFFNFFFVIFCSPGWFEFDGVAYHDVTAFFAFFNVQLRIFLHQNCTCFFILGWKVL